WDRYYSPIARLRMRQGFGRLMRKAKDRGVFVLLDSRVANGTASTDFESELPIQLDRAADIGSGISPMTETVREILAHLRLTREYRIRQQFASNGSEESTIVTNPSQ